MGSPPRVALPVAEGRCCGYWAEQDGVVLHLLYELEAELILCDPATQEVFVACIRFLVHGCHRFVRQRVELVVLWRRGFDERREANAEHEPPGLRRLRKAFELDLLDFEALLGKGLSSSPDGLAGFRRGRRFPGIVEPADFGLAQFFFGRCLNRDRGGRWVAGVGTGGNFEEEFQVFNLMGNPAATAPVSRSAEGLPIGVQIVGRHYEDAKVVAITKKLAAALGTC